MTALFSVKVWLVNILSDCYLRSFYVVQLGTAHMEATISHRMDCKEKLNLNIVLTD